MLRTPIKSWLPAALIPLAVATGCSSNKTAVTQRRQQAVLRAMQSPDGDLQAAENQLARDIADRGPADAFARFSDATTIRVVPAGPMPQGAQQWGPLFATLPQGALLIREPRDGRASVSGDLGWTWGDYSVQFPADSGLQAVHGRYLTVWHRSGDGTWRISADMSESGQ
jgi:ketosteroid isomerase-like protein